ncbi:hypothetical protein AAKU58_003952 [Oxalobacteraceae bacterium GrIS 1.18]
MTNKSTGLAAGRPSVKKQQASMEDEVVLVRINAQITEQQHEKLKIYAAKNKKSVRDLISAFIDGLPD